MDNNMQLTILVLLILGIIYIPVETIVLVVGITLIGFICYAVKRKKIAADMAETNGAYEKLTNPNYVKPGWFSTPLVIYAMIAGIMASLVYFY